MIQQQVAAQLTGHQLPQASISAMERGFDGEFASKIKALGPAGYLRSTSHRAGEDVLVDKEE